MKYSLSFLLLLFSLNLNSQTFQVVPSTFTDCSQGGLSWGDYDNDGDLDAVMSGVLEAGSGVMIYRNKNGEFTKLTTTIPGLTLGTTNWGDYDNDHDLDLLVCGTNSTGDGMTKIYRNDDGTFNETGIALTGITSGKAIWLDYNKDDLLDVLITGDTLYVTPVTKLFKNNGNGTFSYVQQNIPGVLECFVTAGDYDNDADQDILIGGVFDADYQTHLYRNDNGIFNESGIQLFGVAYGSGLFFDYDNDADLDIIYMGATVFADYRVKIYRNDCNSVFTVSSDSLEGEWVGRIDACDINNDGFMDLGITGSLCCGNALSRIYMNNTNGHFEESSVALPDLYFSQINFGDFDNDGDADFILDGIPPDGPGTTYTRLYRNMSMTNTYTANTAPSIPGNLSATVTGGNDIEIQWDPSNDNNTPSAALTYSLRIGTMPGSSDVMTTMSDAGTGISKIYGHGNVLHNTSWKINNLAMGTYYCSVQALDQSGLASEFAQEITFEIGFTGINNLQDNGFSVFPNPASEHINISVSGNVIYQFVDIYDITGKKVISTIFTGNNMRIGTNDLTSGIYKVVLYGEGKTVSQTIAIN